MNGNVWYTKNDPFVYGIVTDWPDNDVLSVASPQADLANTKITMLGVEGELTFTIDGMVILNIEFPSMSKVYKECGVTCQYGYVLKFENLINLNTEKVMPKVEIAENN